METEKLMLTQMWDGYCPESKLKGKLVRMRLNKWGFYESEETGLQIAIAYPGVQCVILKFRGKGDFRVTGQYADERVDGELFSPQTMDRPPFCDAVTFADAREIEEYIPKEVNRQMELMASI
jgi:hypothetical protein